jgi:hypothetical protein
MTQFEEGIFQARITAWGFTKAKTDSVQYYITVRIQGKCDKSNPDGLLEAPELERTVFRTLSSEDQLGWLLSDLRRIGFKGTTLTSLDPRSPDAVDFTGQVVTVRCSYREWQNVVREQWDLVREAVERIGLEKVRELEERFADVLDHHKTRLAESADDHGTPPPSPAPPAEDGEDDNPF